MYAEKFNNQCNDVIHVIENLSHSTAVEMVGIFGYPYENILYQAILQNKTESYVIKLKKTNEAVGLFGLTAQNLNKKSAGIYLLTTDNLKKGNIITFLKEAKKQVDVWTDKYDLLMDTCFKENKTIVKWLTLLGFKPSQYQDDNLQLYFKGDLSLYEPM